jgi:hypothetical protein
LSLNMKVRVGVVGVSVKDGMATRRDRTRIGDRLEGERGCVHPGAVRETCACWLVPLNVTAVSLSPVTRPVAPSVGDPT